MSDVFGMALLDYQKGNYTEDITTFLKGIKAGEYHKGNCFVVAGGAGCVNICSIYDFIDMAVFGRAEGQAHQIIDKQSAPNIWTKQDDPNIENIINLNTIWFLNLPSKL